MVGGRATTRSHLPCCHGDGLPAIVQGLDLDKGTEWAGGDCMAGVGMSGMMGEQGHGRKERPRKRGQDTKTRDGTEMRAREIANECQRHGQIERHLEATVEWMPSTVSGQQGVTGMPFLPTALSPTDPLTAGPLLSPGLPQQCSYWDRAVGDLQTLSGSSATIGFTDPSVSPWTARDNS